MRVGEVDTAPRGRVGAMRDGILDQKFLLTGEDNSPNNYLLNVGRTGGGGWGDPPSSPQLRSGSFCAQGPLSRRQRRRDGRGLGRIFS